MLKPISRSKKFISLSTWLREGKTFHRGVFLYLKKWKTSTRNVDFFLSCVQFCRMRSSTSLENSFTKRRAGAKKSYFFKQRSFCRCKGKTGDCLPKIERWWRFWIAEDGLSKCKACSNQFPGWKIFCAFPAVCCRTWPDLATVGIDLHEEAPATYGAKKATKILHDPLLVTRLCLW